MDLMTKEFEKRKELENNIWMELEGKFKETKAKKIGSAIFVDYWKKENINSTKSINSKVEENISTLSLN